MMLFNDMEFWKLVWRQWKETVTGSYSAKFLLAGYVVTVLLATVAIPDSIGVVSGIALTGLLIIGGFLHSTYKVWENERSAAMSQVPGTHAEIVPDWTIRDLFFHLDPNVTDKYPNAWELVGAEIKDKLSVGQLRIWGREIYPYKKPSPLIEIDKRYWINASFSYWFLDPDHIEAKHTYVPSGTNFAEYCDLRVSKAQALGIWPGTDFGRLARENLASQLEAIKSEILAVTVINNYPVVLHKLRQFLLEKGLAHSPAIEPFFQTWLSNAIVEEGRAVLAPGMYSDENCARLKDDLRRLRP